MRPRMLCMLICNPNGDPIDVDHIATKTTRRKAGHALQKQTQVALARMLKQQDEHDMRIILVIWANATVRGANTAGQPRMGADERQMLGLTEETRFRFTGDYGSRRQLSRIMIGQQTEEIAHDGSQVYGREQYLRETSHRRYRKRRADLRRK